MKLSCNFAKTFKFKLFVFVCIASLFFLNLKLYFAVQTFYLAQHQYFDLQTWNLFFVFSRNLLLTSTWSCTWWTTWRSRSGLTSWPSSARSASKPSPPTTPSPITSSSQTQTWISRQAIFNNWFHLEHFFQSIWIFHFLVTCYNSNNQYFGFRLLACPSHITSIGSPH